MPEDLLLELKTAVPVAGSLENIEDLLRIVMRELVRVAEGMKGTTLRFKTVWRHIVADVAKGQTATIQEARPELLRAFEEEMRALKQTHALLAWLHKRGRTNLPDQDALLPEIAGMEQLRARVFDPWQTAEDLEDLAARDYLLSTADLEKIGTQRRPPASYYAEESKPF